MESDDELLRREKQLKVKVPLRQHLRLHSLKVLTGQNISETVEEALTEYLGDADEVPEPDVEP